RALTRGGRTSGNLLLFEFVVQWLLWGSDRSQVLPRRGRRSGPVLASGARARGVGGGRPSPARPPPPVLPVLRGTRRRCRTRRSPRRRRSTSAGPQDPTTCAAAGRGGVRPRRGPGRRLRAGSRCCRRRRWAGG